MTTDALTLVRSSRPQVVPLGKSSVQGALSNWSGLLWSTPYIARTRLYLLIVFLLNAILGAIDGLVWLLGAYPHPTTEGIWRAAAVACFTATSGLAWLLASRRPPPVSGAILQAVVTLFICWGYVVVSLLLSGPGEPEAVYMGLILIALLLVLRSSLVPSHVLMTMSIGLLAVAVLVVFTIRTMPEQVSVVFHVWIAILGTALVAVTMVTSHTIYGLERRDQVALRFENYSLEGELTASPRLLFARHLFLGRETVIKSLGTVDEKVGSVWQLASRIQHPAFPTIYEVGLTPSGLWYAAMEYLPGVSLEQVVTMTGPLPQDRARRILLQVVAGLEILHAQGVAHGNLAPSHVMLYCDDEGNEQIKLLNAGRIEDPLLGRAPRAAAVGEALRFAPPERILAPEDATIPGDVYSVGVLVLYLLTGEHYLRADELRELVGSKFNAPEPTLNLGNRPLEEALASCLAVGSHERPSSLRLLFERLSSFQPEGTSWTPDQVHAWWSEYEQHLSTVAETAPSGVR